MTQRAERPLIKPMPPTREMIRPTVGPNAIDKKSDRKNVNSMNEALGIFEGAADDSAEQVKDAMKLEHIIARMKHTSVPVVALAFGCVISLGLIIARRDSIKGRKNAKAR
ncbi:MAG: hypothetical protein SGI74_13600 [Oligoflexia bacterium]|nr:hypothetical protein [Oligoflexia bacterium]